VGVVGQPAVRLEHSHRLPDVGLHSDKGGEQQHAAAEAQKHRRDRRLPRYAGPGLTPALGEFHWSHTSGEGA